MKSVSVLLALQTAFSVIGFSASSRAQDTTAVSKQSLQAKEEYCKTCHGLSGQGYRGSSPMPRLAGQQTVYFENQLRAFAERNRDNKFMFGVSHVLNPEMRLALAKHFSELNPKPLGGAPRDLVAAGKKIYEEGVPADNIIPCATCHGPAAKGNGEFPRLAGQLNDYIYNELVNWAKKRGQDPAKPDASAMMKPIAHSLTTSQIKAIAAYVSYLE